MSQPDQSHEKLIALLNKEISAFDINDPHSYAPILDKMGNAQLVLLGEESHGTHEFYQARARLSRYLIEQKHFNAIAIEGDWTSAYPVHLYLQGQGALSQTLEALAQFKNFPLWMWRNKVMLRFLHWLRGHNDQIEGAKKVGFYGLDLYCLYEALAAVLDYLKQHDPLIAKKAAKRYACFDHHAFDSQKYGYLVSGNLKKSCVKEVIEQLLDMQRFAFAELEKQDGHETEALFYALQSARLIKNAEHYYRALFASDEITWNIRDQHMMETLENLVAHLSAQQGERAKIIIWAHNSHIGDARATEMSERHEVNLGQLVRERFDTGSFLLGFSTYQGSVTAASEWGALAEIKAVNPAIAESYEDLFHQLQYKNFFLSLREESLLNRLLKLSRLQRAIGVVYLPQTERWSHYYFARLPYQFDGLIHLDHTHAVQALTTRAFTNVDLPETYPEGV